MLPKLKKIGSSILVVVALLVYGYQQYSGDHSTGSGAGGADAVLAAYAERRSGDMLTSSGIVEKVLRDDNEGSRHQRFILRVADGHTVLVAHNIDLAPRVPLNKGDLLSLRGQYEWKERGGVIHWTHHDPSGRHAEGWIEHNGKRYE